MKNQEVKNEISIDEKILKTKEKANKYKVISVVLFLIILATIPIWLIIIINMDIGSNAQNSSRLAKPIIYIYPEEEIKVTVKLGNIEKLTTTYPKYEGKWDVLAKPNGTLKYDNKEYYALYWEGKNTSTNKNITEGFCIKGEDSAKFLEEKLEILGLNRREAEEFIVYWLPQLEGNQYNLIRFETLDEINNNMPLIVEPKPETMIRILMEFKGTETYKEIPEQQLEKIERKGYTVVEWGGTNLDDTTRKIK